MGEVVRLCRHPVEQRRAARQRQRRTEKRLANCLSRLLGEIAPLIEAAGADEIEYLGSCLISRLREPGWGTFQAAIGQAVASALLTEATQQRLDSRLHQHQQAEEDGADPAA